MTTRTTACCSIYEKRPKLCRIYPTIDYWTPSECTYYFAGEERRGTCACGIGACCAEPREKGEPAGPPMPAVAGGSPCKYLVYKDVPLEKTAAYSTLQIVDDRHLLLDEAVAGD